MDIDANIIDSTEGTAVDQHYHTDIVPMRGHKENWVMKTMLLNVRATKNMKRVSSSPLRYKDKEIKLEHGQYAWFSPTETVHCGTAVAGVRLHVVWARRRRNGHASISALRNAYQTYSMNVLLADV